VLSLVDPRPVLTPAQLDLARWLSEQSLAPLAQCIDRMLPPGLSQQAELVLHLNAEQLAALPAGALPAPETIHARLLDLLKRRGDLRAGQIERALNHPGWRNVAHSLARRGLVRMSSVLPPPTVHAKLVRTVQLACTREAAEAALPHLARAPALPRSSAARLCCAS
jgi:primosomal protein N' (replication factor Y)